MRVISGIARGCSLTSLEGLSTRPTTDRVKEAMFSIINFYISQSNVLDLFSGSGALGIEALSRGAKRCVFVESSAQALGVVNKNLEKTKLKDLAVVKNTDFKSFLSSCTEVFDIILLDPPYNKKMCDEALKIIFDKGLLSDDGIIVCETEHGEEIETEFFFKKSYKYGKTQLSLFSKDG